MLILGSFFFSPFLPIDFQTLDKIKTTTSLSEKEKTKISLNIREHQMVGEFYEKKTQIWMVGIILEIQNFSLSGNRIMIKMVIQDINGLRIALKFINFTEISPKKQMEIQKNFFPLSGKKSEFIGKKVCCYGYFQEDSTQGTIRFIIKHLIPLNQVKIIIITLTPEQSSSYSVQSLIRFVFSNKLLNENENQFPLPIFINIKGQKRSELIRTKFLTNEKLAGINIEKLRKLGFNCGLFNLK